MEEKKRFFLYSTKEIAAESKRLPRKKNMNLKSHLPIAHHRSNSNVLSQNGKNQHFSEKNYETSKIHLPALLSIWSEDIENNLIPNVIFPPVNGPSNYDITTGASVPAYRVLPLLACHFASPTSQTNANIHSLLVHRKLHYDLWKDCDESIVQRTNPLFLQNKTEETKKTDNVYRPISGWGLMKPLLNRIWTYNYENVQLLPLYKYRSIEESDTAVYNTLQFMFFHVKNGIYVKIKDGKLAAFAPFHNMESTYCNNWAHVPSSRPLRIGNKDMHQVAHASSETIEAMKEQVHLYYRKKKEMWGSLYSDEGYNPDPRTWWANAGIIDNVQTSDGWSTARNSELKEMLEKTCEAILVPDCDFFLNKRDFPHLHYDFISQQLKEPYPFLFENVVAASTSCIAESSPSLVTHASVQYSSTSRFAPIFSLTSSSVGNFADLLFPLPDDWKIATGNDSDIVSLRSAPSSCWNWTEKKNQLVWRGSATGPGVLPETNQRLGLVKLAQKYPKLMDCQLTGLNLRDRVNDLSGQMEYLVLETAIDVCKSTKQKTVQDFVKMKKTNYMTFVDQCKYKYLIYVQGHSAAFRYGKMMFSNSLILKVQSTVMADKLWFFDALKGYSPFADNTEQRDEDWKHCDHIIVKSDLSDLVSILEWCELHDDLCSMISRNAYTLATQLFTKDNMMQYIHNSLIQVHLNRTHFITEFLPIVAPPPPSFDQDSLVVPQGKKKSLLETATDFDYRL